jgi:hypothetical protein
VLPDVFLVALEHIRRCRHQGLRRLIKFKAGDIAHILHFADPQDDASKPRIEVVKDILRRYLLEVPRPDSTLHRFEDRVLTDARYAAQHQPVVDLDVRLLASLREPSDDAVGIVWLVRTWWTA